MAAKKKEKSKSENWAPALLKLQWVGREELEKKWEKVRKAGKTSYDSMGDQMNEMFDEEKMISMTETAENGNWVMTKNWFWIWQYGRKGWQDMSSYQNAEDKNFTGIT